MEVDRGGAAPPSLVTPDGLASFAQGLQTFMDGVQGNRQELVTGCHVELFDLVARPELNHRTGIVQSVPTSADGRVAVKLHDEAQPVRVKRNCVRWVAPPMAGFE